ncbi:MutS-related protein [Fulvimonas soli]|uniref:MutS-like protein n=1 Tax=Fulvimonas soli TaxID=155197 RepID=A0A316I8F0_9GAMM|nr:DNA mismatch repair protein MutS [Fulvimonas soli]PWK89723.1 MutS-like protein [Fulvimonas soli]TNY27629.1 DNA mismatch repair protein MutS [Fulvimonas soli]
MKAYLMHPDRDFDAQRPAPSHEALLRQDLGLDVLLHAMAGGDDFLLDIARKALLQGLHGDVPTILHRQAALRDALRQPEVVRQLYALAVEAIENRKKNYWSFLGDHPTSILHGAISMLRMFMDVLEKLRGLAEAHAGGFASRGFGALFAMLREEFDDAYLGNVRAHLAELRFKDGVLMSAMLGPENQGNGYVLRRPHPPAAGWLRRAFGKRPPAYTFRIAERDLAGARTLAGMRDRAINDVANALAQSMDHILAFFEMLRAELAFYVGCLNLHARLEALGVPTAFPAAAAAGSGTLGFEGLCDAALALAQERPPVGNTLAADGKRLLVVTGANQGGKSTFMRSLGLAQLMMQAGMFVTARAFAAELCGGLFTHYKREEDAAMASGKFDEELARLSDLAGQVGPGALVLFNESFASTNEREGSEVARQVVEALLARNVKVVFVTHLYTFARGLYERRMPDALFLRAQRLADGTRTFRLAEGEPLETSHGADLYRQVFGEGQATSGDGGAGRPDDRTAHAGAGRA